MVITNRFTNRPIELMRKLTIISMVKYGKFCNKLFAEVVNTEINCMQVKKKCLQEGGDTKKVSCSRRHI